MVNRNILLVYVNPVNFPIAQPKGLEILTSFLNQNGYEVNIISPFQESFYPYKFIEDFLNENDYLFIGLSFRNFDNAGFHYNTTSPTNYIGILKKVISVIKKIDSSCPILIGGSGFSIDSINLLKELELKYGIQGAGEHSINEFANLCVQSNSNKVLEDKIKNKLLNKQLPGFILSSDNEILSNQIKKEYINPPKNFIDKELQNPVQNGHPIRINADRHSGAKRTPVPI